MMESWEELYGVQSGPEWKDGGREMPKEELELTKMDTLIMQVSKMSRFVAEVRESCQCLEESISMEEKEQAELESALKSSTIAPLGGLQHSVTETNLQTSTQLMKDHIEGDDKENEILEEELVILIKKLADMKESKRTKLKVMQDQYGIQLVGKGEIEQQKRIVELKHKKNVLIMSSLKLKQKRHRTQKEWSNFTESMISVAKLQNMIKNKCLTMQHLKTSIQNLQSAVLSRKRVESLPIIRREIVEDSKQLSTHSLSSSSFIPQHNLTTPKTSSSTFIPTLQGQDHPQARYSFSTSLSLLKLPFTKFGDKKKNNCSWNIQKSGEKTMESSASEDCPQSIDSLRCSQVQPTETFQCLFKNYSQITADNEPNNLSLDCQHNPMRNKLQMCNQTPRVTNVSPTQGNTNNLIDSFSCEIFTPANSQTLEASTSKDIDCSSFISQDGRGPSSSHETLSISPHEYRSLQMASQKFKSDRIPLAKPKSAEVTTLRGSESSHIKVTGVVAPCLLSRSTHVPPSSKGIGKSSPRHLSIYSQVPQEKSCKRYNDPSLVNNEISGFSLSAKHVTYNQGLQELSSSTDYPVEKSAASENCENDSFLGPSSNVVPPPQYKTTHSILPIPMEVDNHESLKVTSCMSSFKKSNETRPAVKDKLHYFGVSQQSSNTTLSVVENSKDDIPVSSCIPAVSHEISSSASSSDLISKELKKSKSPNMKFLQYTHSPLASSANLDHASQGFTSSTCAVENCSSSMLENSLQDISERNLQFSLFESTLADSSAQEPSRTSRSNFFTLEDCVSSRTDNTTSSLFSFNADRDGESTEHGDSSFFSSLFDSSSDITCSSNEMSGFPLF